MNGDSIQKSQRPLAEQATDESRMRVLVVDDSAAQRRVLERALSREGYNVREAASGVEALELCASWSPDLVISDWMMPGMNGLEFCEAFHEMPRDGYGYFILLTSKSDKSAVAEGLETGADDFLTKPVHPHELRARISAGRRIVQMHQALQDKSDALKDALNHLQVVHDSLNNDLIEAKNLQQSLVREKYKCFDHGAASFLLHPSGHVGGDLVGYFPVNERQIGLYSIDVSGHGVSSALMTARLAGYLSSSTPEQNVALMRGENGQVIARPVADVVDQLNSIVLDEMETDHYFTIVLAVVDLHSGTVSLCQAGHPFPAIERKSGGIEFVGDGGFPVGLLHEGKFEETQVMLHRGDRLLLVSDGVTECETIDGKMVGDEGLISMMTEMRDVTTQAYLDHMLDRLHQTSGLDGFDDDVSAVFFEWA